ncbi:MAG: hypothetical protein ACYCQI_09480 [Gammaproteobacteria bacterium]
MPALSCEFKKINLSYTHEGLTIYWKFEDEEQTLHLQFAITNLGSIRSLSIIPLSDRVTYAIKDRFAPIRFVKRKEDDHAIYHKDTFDFHHLHSHFKFNHPLNRGELQQILAILIQYKLITPEERSAFFIAYDHRYATSRKQLTRKLLNPEVNVHSKMIEIATVAGSKTSYKKADKTIVIQSIKTCLDNDILADLHALLKTTPFDYLRELTSKHKISFWRGTNVKGDIVKTSRSWAMIEKAIFLQMAHNIAKESKFTKDVGYAYAQDLARAHHFFKIGRHCLNPYNTSKTYRAFKNGETLKLDREYQKVFGNSPR